MNNPTNKTSTYYTKN